MCVCYVKHKKVHLAESSHIKDFLQEIKKKKKKKKKKEKKEQQQQQNIKSTILILEKKTKNILAMLFLHILHMLNFKQQAVTAT